MWNEEVIRLASAQPEKPAVIEGDRALAYGRLVEAASALARRLAARGLGPGRTVATQMPNSLESAVAVLAVSQIGATHLILDPALKPAEVERYYRRAGAEVLLLAPDSAATDWPAGLATWPLPYAEALAREARAEKAAALVPASPPADANAFLLLSSGTSGAPKIVPKTLRQAAGALTVYGRTLPYRESDRVLAALPFFHSFGLFNVLVAALEVGATLVIDRFSPRPTAATVERHRITVLPAAPFMFWMLGETPFRTPADFSTVRLAVSVGSALSPAVAARMREKFSLGVAQSYGTTESGPATLARPEESTGVAGWVGRPYKGVTIEIRGPPGAPLAASADGEIAVHSPANAAGYLDGPEASAETFRGEWVLTGDIGHLDAAGHLFVLGRKKRMVNVAGKKVSAAEVETCLRNHPAVAEVVVLADPTPDGTERAKALVVRAGPVTAGDLVEFCAARLADFKVPRHIVFVENLADGAMQKPKG